MPVPDPLPQLTVSSHLPPEVEEVHGKSGRVRISKAGASGGEPNSPLKSVAPKLGGGSAAAGSWMDEERKKVQAYEYLCHIGEVKQWIEASVGEQIEPLSELEESMRNGVAVAKLARTFAPNAAKKIFEHPKLQFRHSDNINCLFAAMREVGLPEIFYFELTDLYDKKNFPKVVYCLHALAHLLYKKGLTRNIENLIGKLEFTDEEVEATQKGLEEAGISMPLFGDIGSTLEKELKAEEQAAPPEQRGKQPPEAQWSVKSDNIVRCQAFVRGRLARRRYQRQKKERQDERRRKEEQEVEEQRQEEERTRTRKIVKCQALVRGRFARRQYRQMKDDIAKATPGVIRMQALARGHLARKRRQKEIEHFKEHEKEVTKLQNFVRMTAAKKAYHSLIHGTTPPVNTVRLFVHIPLDTSNRDLEEELEVEQLRRQVIIMIRENSELEANLNELDNKIALLVRNRITIEEVVKYARHRKLTDSREKLLAGSAENLAAGSTYHLSSPAAAESRSLGSGKLFFGDRADDPARPGPGEQAPPSAKAASPSEEKLAPASASPEAAAGLEAAAAAPSLKPRDKDSRRRLLLYQQLFYLLQTQQAYIAKLLFYVDKPGISESQKKFVESAVLPIFGYAQNAREEYLLLKLFHASIQQELTIVTEPSEIMRGNPLFIKLSLQYSRGAKDMRYLRDVLQPCVNYILQTANMELDTDPLTIYRAHIRREEVTTGEKSSFAYDATREQALAHEPVREAYVGQLRQLQNATGTFLDAIITRPKSVPFGIRSIAQKLREAMTAKFGQRQEDQIMRVIGHFLYYRYINPAIVAPEAFGVVELQVDPRQRKNLGEISKVLNHVVNCKVFEDDNEYLRPLNEFLQESNRRFTTYLKEVTNVESLEDHFQVDEYGELTRMQKPVIYISPQEVLGTHAIVAKLADELAPSPADPIRILVSELGSPPDVDFDQDIKAGAAISLTLTNRFTQIDDNEIERKHLFVETKRLVLYAIAVQAGKNLLDVLERPVTGKEQAAYEKLLQLEAEKRLRRERNAEAESPGEEKESPGASPTKPIASVADISGLSLENLKKLVLENMAKLEEMGKVSKENNYQDMLDDIVKDIREKSRRRQRRQQELVSIKRTIESLNAKASYLVEQRKTYNDYIIGCMTHLRRKDKAKKPRTVPFSRQYFHQRELKKSGKIPQFGSYKYTAEKLIQKGVLLSVEDYSLKQLDKLSITVSSDEDGVFRIEASLFGAKIPGGEEELRIEDLLQAQFDGLQMIRLFDGAVKVNLNLLIFLINKKFYA